jgi:O-antigen ligase
MRLGFSLLAAAYLQALHFLPWFSWHSEVLAFVALMCLVASAFGCDVQEYTPSYRIPKIIGFLLVAMGLVVLQWAFGLITFGGDALVFIVYLFACSAAISVGYQWGACERHSGSRSLDIQLPLQGLAACILTAAVLSVFVALVQTTQVSTFYSEWVLPPVSTRRPGANLGQPNQLATLLLLGCVSLGMLREGWRLSTTCTILLLGVLLLGLAMTESRTALVSALALSAWWFIKRDVVQFSWARLGIPLFWIFLVSAMWSWPHLIIAFHEGNLNTPQTASGLNMTAGSRVLVWQQLAQAVLQRPWFGWGIGGVSKAHNMVLDQYEAAEPFTYAHNIFLDMAVGWGVPLATAAAVGIAWWGVTRLSRVNSLATWYSAALIIPVAVHSQLEFPFAYAYFIVPAMLGVGVLEAHAQLQKSWNAPRRVIAIFSVGYIGVLLWIAVEYFRIEEDFRVARFEAFHVGQTAANYERPNIYLLSQLDALLHATRSTPQTGMTTLQLQMLRDAALRFPWSALQNRYALALALNGDPKEAVRQLKVMRAMHGEQMYAAIRAQWDSSAREKFPTLKGLAAQ